MVHQSCRNAKNNVAKCNSTVYCPISKLNGVIIDTAITATATATTSATTIMFTTFLNTCVPLTSLRHFIRQYLTYRMTNQAPQSRRVPIICLTVFAHIHLHKGMYVYVCAHFHWFYWDCLVVRSSGSLPHSFVSIVKLNKMSDWLALL